MSEEDLKVYESKEQLKLIEYTTKYEESIKQLKYDDYKPENLTIDVLGNLLIELPYKIYARSLESLEIIDEIPTIVRTIEIIEDNTSMSVNQIEELKNQAQRDASKRMMLLDNNNYNLLKKQLAILNKHKSLLNFQKEYFDNLFTGVKIRYRQMCQVVLNDKELKDL